MPTYFLSTNLNPEQTELFERRIKSAIPEVRRIAKLEDITQEAVDQTKEPSYILVAGPADNDSYLDRFINIATQYRDRFFFILVSEDISTNNYKRLVRVGSADWVSMSGAPQEITEILAKRRAAAAAEAAAATAAATAASVPATLAQAAVKAPEVEPQGPRTVAFLPCAGGVGNTTLVAEVGIGLRLQKATKDRKICVIDLDFQTSHICDYLDLEPRLQIQEISENPKRLDAQLFEIFISRHSSGLDIFAAPRSKFDFGMLDIKALDALFEMIAKRYELILVDLPVTWFPWTADIIGHSSAVVVTGINTIPGLRQLSESLTAVRSARPNANPETVAIAVNRCERTLLGGVERRQHVESVLGREKTFFVGNDPAAMVESANTGTALMQSVSSRRTAKEIMAIAEFCADLKSANVKAA